MPQTYGVVKDTLTGLYCSLYSTQLESCEWGNLNNAVHFIDLAAASAVAQDMNGQASTQDRFIGQNPPPR